MDWRDIENLITGCLVFLFASVLMAIVFGLAMLITVLLGGSHG